MNGAMTTRTFPPTSSKQAVASQHGGEVKGSVQAVPFEFMSIHGNS